MSGFPCAIGTISELLGTLEAFRMLGYTAPLCQTRSVEYVHILEHNLEKQYCAVIPFIVPE